MKNSQQGITLVEVVIFIVIATLMYTVARYYLQPEERKEIARDNKRLSDISTLDRAINEYLLDNGAYPDFENILRDSSSLPSGSISLDHANTGWINANLSRYTQRLPTDPLNTSPFLYEYMHDTSTYELNAVLENLANYAENDGGDDPNVYEIGNNLTLINP